MPAASTGGAWIPRDHSRPDSASSRRPLFGLHVAGVGDRPRSISPAAHRRAGSRACSLSQTPARCHSSRRRQQVIPERFTQFGWQVPRGDAGVQHEEDAAQRRAVRQALAPGQRKRRGCAGGSGSISSQSLSMDARPSASLKPRRSIVKEVRRHVGPAGILKRVLTPCVSLLCRGDVCHGSRRRGSGSVTPCPASRCGDRLSERPPAPSGTAVMA